MKKVLISALLVVLVSFGFLYYKKQVATAPVQPSDTSVTEDRTVLLQSAIDLKNNGDYRRAEEILLRITGEWKTDFVAFNNLGDLYQNYLKDYPKAETAHKKVIALNPAFIQAYINLYDLYRLYYTEKKDQAVVILREGLKNNPKDTQLRVLLERE